MSRLHEEMAQMSSHLLLLHYIFCLYPLLQLQGELPSTSPKKTTLGLVYRWFCKTCRHHLKLISCNTTASFQDTPEGQWQGEIPPAGRMLSSVPCCSLEEKMARVEVFTVFVGCYQWFGWIVKDLED